MSTSHICQAAPMLEEKAWKGFENPTITVPFDILRQGFWKVYIIVQKYPKISKSSKSR